jgi:glucose/arabinose dehydrogenase
VPPDTSPGRPHVSRLTDRPPDSAGSCPFGVDLPLRSRHHSPPGFSDNLVAAVGAPTALAFTPDGRLLITSQGGDLRVVTPGIGAPAGNVTVASGFAAGTADLVIDVMGWWR